MEHLYQISDSLLRQAPKGFTRYLYSQVAWANRLIGIKGARGTGKTTMLLQWLYHQPHAPAHKLYLSLDDIYFTQNSLLEVATQFQQLGGKVMVLDEVHKYLAWSRDIKNLYDRYPDLQIVFTGSSIIDIARQEADLSRRALMYELRGMSYREYLLLAHHMDLPVVSLENLVQANTDIRSLFPSGFRPLALFGEYLRQGYYPFVMEDLTGFHTRLRQLTRAIVEYDMAELKGFDIRHAKKMLQLLYVVAQQVPFKPNLQALADKTAIHRNSINNYLYYLQEARLLHLLYKDGISVSTLQKPEKVYLDNPNLLYALAQIAPSAGTLREVFFLNQASGIYHVAYGNEVDFIVNQTYLFEVGGMGKSTHQLKGQPKAWVVKDNMEWPTAGQLPLWLFGFLY